MGKGLSRRKVIAGGAGTAAAAALPGAAFAQQTVVRVAEFGARGDGVTNDSEAIAAAARTIERMGGGVLAFEAKNYLIGRQRRGAGTHEWAFEPSPIVDIRRCQGKVTLQGNGARLICAPGLRFGTFDPRTGRATANPMPFTDNRQLASPYRAAIWLQENTGGIEVSGFQIDGRIGRAIIGGPFGDTGWQINHCGLWIYNNRGPHVIRDIDAHNHGQDGILLFTQITRESAPAVPMLVENVRCEYNGRQGLSLTGGKGVTIRNSRFSHTGRNGAITSNPGAGIDVEAELSLIRDVTVVDCEFEDNHGQGMVADNGNSAGLTFERCKFVGATNYAVWPNKPRIRFVDCEIVGALARCFEDPAGTARATQFVRCRFYDDPARSSSRRVYGSRIDLGGSGNGTLFDRCEFRYTHAMQLPYTERVRFHSCTMSQVSREEAYPRGIFTGTSTIRGRVNLGSSIYRGTLTVNGIVMPRNG